MGATDPSPVMHVEQRKVVLREMPVGPNAMRAADLEAQMFSRASMPALVTAPLHFP